MPGELIHLSEVNSTNDYAMALINAEKAEHGTTALADMQTAGKGQRGRRWSGAAGESVLMSIVIRPQFAIGGQPGFLALVARSVIDTIARFVPGVNAAIKWPNDIIISDKKAGGILIENVLRGPVWQWAVVGIGLNVQQVVFADDLSNAISLKAAAGVDLNVKKIAIALRENLLYSLEAPADTAAIWRRYNDRLYGRGQEQLFKIGMGITKAKILGVDAGGLLCLEFPDGMQQQFAHGTVEWIWS